jgi:hypothetical protein
LTGNITINVSEGNVTSFAAEVLEILPAGVLGDAKNNDSDSRGPASTHRGTVSIFVRVTTRTGLLSKFNNDVLAHEIFAIEVMQCIFGISGIFKLDKPEASHDTTIDDFAISIEKFGHIFGPCIRRKLWRSS